MLQVSTIPTDGNSWSDFTRSAPDWQFRISTLRGVVTLWRNSHHPALYGGHQIHRIALDTRLAREWLDIAGYDTFKLNMDSKH